MDTILDPYSPEVETRVEGLIALFLIQPPKGVFGEAVPHEWVQVAVPFDLDANDAPLWPIQEKKKP